MLKDQYTIGVVDNINQFYVTLKDSKGFLSEFEISNKILKGNDYYIKENYLTNSPVSLNDVLMIWKNGKYRILYKHNSNDNLLFTTDQCNSSCLMCSQPPKKVYDIDHFYNINNTILDLIPKDIKVMGITGGEPTLLGNKLILLLRRFKFEFPNTNVHILTNGKYFSKKQFVLRLASNLNNKTVFGVPLYSDIPSIHDYIVQSKNAFYQTVIGLHNAARYGLKIEIRVVITNLNYQRLPDLAKYIYMNFPFVNHVAFMGLEYTGYAIINNKTLKIKPEKFSEKLIQAVSFLTELKINTSIYNLPLCLINSKLWPYSARSISDWKQEYIDVCKSCDVLDRCGGFFTTSRFKYENINPITLSKEYIIDEKKEN